MSSFPHEMVFFHSDTSSHSLYLTQTCRTHMCSQEMENPQGSKLLVWCDFRGVYFFSGSLYQSKHVRLTRACGYKVAERPTRY